MTNAGPNDDPKRPDDQMRRDDPKPYDKRPNTIHWPPMLYLLTLAAAYLMQRIIQLPQPVPPPYAQLAGWPLFLFGVMLGGVAIFSFRQLHTPVDPTAPAVRLATDGVYAVTRNPMYLGAVIAFVGLSLVRGSSWLLLFTSMLPLALQRLAIEREEAHLEHKFGDEFRRYKSRVGRWL
jgi:protein-S-isoprenylcysteine O-methyltransferase Ste14